MHKSKYEVARDLAKAALEALHASGQDRAAGHELLSWIKRNHKSQFALVEKSWGSFLTRMLDDPDSHVVREPGRYGYKLAVMPSSQSFPENERAECDEISPAGTSRERRLYALLAQWLAVFMEPAQHKLLCEPSGNEVPMLSLENVRVEEVWPAISDPVLSSTREQFIREVLSISTLQQLHKFGA